MHEEIVSPESLIGVLGRFDPKVRDAMQLSLLRQQAGQCDPSQLGVSREEFEAADQLLREKGIGIKTGFEFVGPPGELEAIKDNCFHAGVPEDAIRLHSDLAQHLRLIAIVDHARGEALRTRLKFDQLNQLILPREVYILTRPKAPDF